MCSCCSVVLTGRDSPLFHDNPLCHCRAGNRLQTLWWHWLRCHSNLDKHRIIVKTVNLTLLRCRRWLCCSLCSFHNLIAPLFCSFFVQFICQSTSSLSDCLSVPFPLTTSQINVVSLYSPSHSSPDLVSLRQRGLLYKWQSSRYRLFGGRRVCFHRTAAFHLSPQRSGKKRLYLLRLGLWFPLLMVIWPLLM